MATYALIHGAYDVGWYWHLVEDELRRRGHRTVAPDLPIEDDDATLLDNARVVTDATANGTQKIGRRVTRTRLRLRGHGVPPAQLALISAGTTTRITGTVAGRRVALRLASAH